MNIISETQKFVELECRQPTSHYGFEPYIYHLAPMTACAQSLAKKLGADLEVVTLAAWLHDIGSIRCGRHDHHITGAKIAEEQLKSLKYPEIKIRAVVNCILHHRSSTPNECETLEEKIIADADALNNFDNIAGPFKAAFIYEHLTQGEASVSVRAKLQRKWQKLHLEESKRIIRPKYEAAMLLLPEEDLWAKQNKK